MTERERQARAAIQEARRRLGLPPAEGYRTRRVNIPDTIFVRHVEIPLLDLDAVLTYVRSNYTRFISRNQVARRFRVTPRRLSALLKEVDMTFETHVRELRLLRSKRLLSLIRRKLPKSSRAGFIRKKVSEVRVEVAWQGNDESFRTAFKQQFGMGPAKYLWEVLSKRGRP